jgi:pilus assembly protein TadC
MVARDDVAGRRHATTPGGRRAAGAQGLADRSAARPSGGRGPRERRPGRHRLAVTRLGAVALSAVVAVLLVGGWPGVAVGAALAIGADRYLRRLEPAWRRAERLRAEADLPFVADLLAAALRAGLPTDRAVAVVADAVDGPVAQRLARVGRSLGLGLIPAQAWLTMADLPAGARLAAAVVRSADSGSALAAAFTRLADDQRARRITEAEAASHRAGVLIVLPLGLCFLPAFVFAGIVPVIVAVLGDVLRSR